MPKKPAGLALWNKICSCLKMRSE